MIVPDSVPDTGNFSSQLVVRLSIESHNSAQAETIINSTSELMHQCVAIYLLVCYSVILLNMIAKITIAVMITCALIKILCACVIQGATL